MWLIKREVYIGSAKERRKVSRWSNLIESIFLQEKAQSCIKWEKKLTSIS